MPFLVCDRCGDPIGVYEPMWLQHPDGSLTDSSFLEIRDRLGDPHLATRFFHQGCLATDASTEEA